MMGAFDFGKVTFNDSILKRQGEGGVFGIFLYSLVQLLRERPLKRKPSDETSLMIL